jgi:hypothetical protein
MNDHFAGETMLAGSKRMREDDEIDVKSKSVHPLCLKLLPQNGNLPFSVRYDETVGSTLVANRALPAGSLLLNLPVEFLITFDTTSSTPLSKIIHSLEKIQISPEELTWLNMIAWLNGPDGPQKSYLESLSTIPPNCSSWTPTLQNELMGCNIHSVLDTSGPNDGVAGNVSVEKNLLELLQQIRSCLQQDKDDEKANMDDSSSAYQMLVETAASIFTASSIQWARGHFLSRRFPDLRNIKSALRSDNDKFLNGYGGKLSTLIPILDFMNHNPCKSDTCTAEIGADGLTLEVRTGEKSLETGEELFYCYGESLSNEMLLQAYGFAIPNNQFDTVSVQISNDNGSATSSPAFCIQSGGVSSVPSEMWKAIAGVSSSSEDGEEAIEIGSGDLKRLLQYMSSKLEQLDLHNSDLDRSIITDPLTNERLKYIQIYKDGQRDILEALVDDLKIMVGQSAEV